MLGEIIFQAIGEVLLYGTGRLVAAVFTPRIHVSRTGADPSPFVTRRGWFALTYSRDGRRYYYDSAVMLLGLLFWALLGLAVFVGVLHFRTLG